MNAKEFGDKLKALRKQKKLTIRQLDLYSGVSNSYISQMESGKRGIPTPDILMKLSKPLGVDYEELMKIAGYIKEDSDYSKPLDKLLMNLASSFNYDPELINFLTVDEKIDFLLTVTEASGNLSVESTEDGTKELKLGVIALEITDPKNIDQLNLTYEGMKLTREEKMEFLAIAKGIFSVRQAAKRND